MLVERKRKRRVHDLLCDQWFTNDTKMCQHPQCKLGMSSSAPNQVGFHIVKFLTMAFFDSTKIITIKRIVFLPRQFLSFKFDFICRVGSSSTNHWWNKRKSRSDAVDLCCHLVQTEKMQLSRKKGIVDVFSDGFSMRQGRHAPFGSNFLHFHTVFEENWPK